MPTCSPIEISTNFQFANCSGSPFLLHQSPQPLDQLWLVVAVVPGPVEGRRGDHEPRRPVPDEGHRVLLDHVDEVGDVLVGSLHADVVHEALERGQPDVDELGSNSIEIFWLEFWPEKSLEFWLEIPYTKKMFKNGYLRHMYVQG